MPTVQEWLKSLNAEGVPTGGGTINQDPKQMLADKRLQELFGSFPIDMFEGFLGEEGKQYLSDLQSGKATQMPFPGAVEINTETIGLNRKRKGTGLSDMIRSLSETKSGKTYGERTTQKSGGWWPANVA